MAEPILVAREKELEELWNCLNSAISGKGKTVFVSGEAGSGKTRLAREFLNAAVKQGVAVMAGWCLSDAQVPYFPFVEAFNSYYASSDAQQPENLDEPVASPRFSEPFKVATQERGITAWVSGASPSLRLAGTTSVSPQVWKDQLFAGVAKTLHVMASEAPVILFIEDVHWADSASLALLHYVSRTIQDSEKVLVIATYRSEELTTDAEGHPHPLAETLRLMRREELFAEIKLSSLSQAAVSRIAENLIGGALQDSFAERLSTESRGNPLFVVESLRMLHERKSLFQENNQWGLAVEELGIPNKIKDIILRRLACLKYAQRRILDAASVIGEEFDVELLSTVLGQDSLDVLETLNVIAHSTSIVCVEGNRYRFDHAKSRETLYEELSPPLKRGYHNRIAEKLENTTSPVLPLSDLAYHCAQSGITEKAVKYALAAAEDELAKYSNDQAIKHFQYVVQNAAEGAEEKSAALEGLGDALYANNMFKESMRIFEKLANSGETKSTRLRAFRKAMESAFQSGSASHLMELVEKAEPYAAADRLESGRVLFSRGRASFMRNGLAAPLKDYISALQIFEEEYSLWDTAFALIGVGGTRAVLDVDRQQGLAQSLRSVALFEELGDFRSEMEACNVLGLAFGASMLVRESLKMHEKVIQTDEKKKIGDYLRLAYANVFSAWKHEFLCNFREALQYSLKALELAKKTDSLLANGAAYASLTRQYALLGDAPHAEECFEKLLELPEEVRSHDWVNEVRTKAIFYAGKKQFGESDWYFKEIFESRKKNPFPYDEAWARLGYAWMLEKQERFDDAQVQLEEVQRVRRESEERFEHSNMQANLMSRRQVDVGEEFDLRLDLVNVGRKPATLVKIKDAVPPEVNVACAPLCFSLQNGILDMKEKSIVPFQVETVKLKVCVTKTGSYDINSEIFYLDDSGKSKTLKTNSVKITVRPTKPAYETLPGRVATGYMELDRLLLGGIPEKYAVVLAAPSGEERQLLIKRFLEAGAKAGETTLFITCEAGDVQELVRQFQTNLYLIACIPQADLMMENQPNVFKLRGIENLTNIDISLTKYLRTLDPEQTMPRIACVDVISDVLLQHHALVTRKWLSSLLATLKSKGFTTLALIDPSMHPSEETNAILGLFDGEIRVAKKENTKVLKVIRLHNQRYSEAEMVLTRGDNL